MTGKVWRYVEIDGKQYEFCDPSNCRTGMLDDEFTIWCLHPEALFDVCVLNDQPERCPARILEGVKVCPECDGAGSIWTIGPMAPRRECTTCKGTGKVLREKCPHCTFGIRVDLGKVNKDGTFTAPLCDKCKGTRWEQ